MWCCPFGFAFLVAMRASSMLWAIPALAVHPVSEKMCARRSDTTEDGSGQPLMSRNASSQLTACEEDI